MKAIKKKIIYDDVIFTNTSIILLICSFIVFVLMGVGALIIFAPALIFLLVATGVWTN